MTKQKLAFIILTVIGAGIITFAIIMGAISQYTYGSAIGWIVYGLVIVIGVAFVLYGRTYRIEYMKRKAMDKGWNE
jgi:hypothetical protein